MFSGRLLIDTGNDDALAGALIPGLTTLSGRLLIDTGNDDYWRPLRVF